MPPAEQLPYPVTDRENGAAQIRAEVFVYSGQELLAKYTIQHGEYIIGRDPTCHIVVNAELVSRHHARLTFTAFELVIEDLGSSNGIFTEGMPVQIPTRVRSDQEIQIGSARLIIRLHEESARQLTDALWDKDMGLEPVRQLLSGAKYKVITTIARGGMGVVMQARDVRIRRTVAMKVMKTASQFLRENVLRFIDEAQLTGQLEHPNIVPVYELAIDEGGETFYTMKFVKGITLDDVLRGLRTGKDKIVAKYPLGALLTIFQKICDGVGFAHSRGVIHRDIKPENIMIGSFGEVLVMDWGLAKHLTGNGRRSEPSRIDKMPEAQGMREARGFETMHGLVVGTPPYISPEQARGELDKLDPRSDIYVLGQILYAMLTLRAPVSGGTVNEIIEQILADQIIPPSSYNTPIRSSRRLVGSEPEPDEVNLLHCPGRRIPESLSAVVMKAMHFEPEARYQTVEEMQRDILAFQGGFATKAERAGPWKQTMLWTGRHKREVALFVTFFVLLVITAISFFVRLKSDRDAALVSASDNEKRAEAAQAMLREGAPSFASDAQSLIDALKFDDALGKIDDGLEQHPERAEFHALRGNVLQSLLRFPEAADSFETALRLDPNLYSAQTNLILTRKLVAESGPDGSASPGQLRELEQAMLEQNRIDEAFGVIQQLSDDRATFHEMLLEAFDKMGLRERVEANGNGTMTLDLSGLDLSRGLVSGRTRRGLSGLREMKNRPISVLNLDGTRLTNLASIKGWNLERLSLNHNPVIDLTPLEGMPLRSLSADGCSIRDLQPIMGLPLESLHLRNTRLDNLQPLQGMPLEQLDLAGCRGVGDLTPLHGMPLQELDLSRTGVVDLTPLIGSPIRELNLEACPDLTDLRPLLEMDKLEALVIPRQCRDIEFLRHHPTLTRLSYQKLTQPVASFWQEFDAAAASAPKDPSSAEVTEGK